MSQFEEELPQEPEELPGREERRTITRDQIIQEDATTNTSDGEEKHEHARVAKELDMTGVIDAGL